ncbi:polysaccharide biosynthesis/export family protein [Rhodoplanes sp. Z2-YC6860]|uniref:polysaccharide biosynthesis/export family protein n=1 Tax=Rhodoplanes sp. Z2-YC6860 TaxID=674703 RepID=UPI00078D0735|nr:polysaccharide biosynthesis/export family protein [Rhodoplanes sp. Z2-YC6860]AMN45484.1 polysaccharide export protein [Rhodoplanes sp. Z2-YC6860]
MRLRLVHVVPFLALAVSACAGPRAHTVALQPTPIEASDLDARMYGAPQPQSYAVRQATRAVPVTAMMEDGPYKLDSGDRLRIVVFGQDTLSNNYTVDAQGHINMPLIGSVPARGSTTAQLSGAITSRLKQSFIRDPSVAVDVETYRPFFVLGEVTFPGQYPYVPNMTVENAIAIAGGFTPRAYKDTVKVTRQVQGSETRYELQPPMPVRPGDTITVTERWF